MSNTKDVVGYLLNGVNAKAPIYMTSLSAGADVFAHIERDLIIPPYKVCSIPTGIILDMQGTGLYAELHIRSGLAKNGIVLNNSVGIIDGDYQGDIIAMLRNLNSHSFTIVPEQRIAQLVFKPLIKVKFIPLNAITPTERGEGGFGSTK